MRATDIERAILTGRLPHRTEETRSMPTQTEIHAAHAQIEQAKSLREIAETLVKINYNLDVLATLYAERFAGTAE